MCGNLRESVCVKTYGQVSKQDLNTLEGWVTSMRVW